MNKMTFNLQNMKCAGCARSILDKVLEVPGVVDVQSNLENEELSFSYSSFNTPELVKAVLKRLGYPLRDEANSLKDQVVSYVSCMRGRVKE